jgi:hypothetical protein
MSKASMSLSHTCKQCGRQISCNWNLPYVKYLSTDIFYIKIYLHHLFKGHDFSTYKSLYKYLFFVLIKAFLCIPLYYLVKLIKAILALIALIVYGTYKGFQYIAKLVLKFYKANNKFIGV